MAIHLLHPDPIRGGSVRGRAASMRHGNDGIAPELAVALARQIPALETDTLVRLITSSLPEATISQHRAS